MDAGMAAPGQSGHGAVIQRAQTVLLIDAIVRTGYQYHANTLLTAIMRGAYGIYALQISPEGRDSEIYA